MKWSEFKKLAAQNGWYLDRHGKRHDIYKHPTIQGAMQIERHESAEIKSGLCSALMKQMKGLK